MRQNLAKRQGSPIPAGREDLCLAYANTLSWRGSPTPSESLQGWADLLAWLHREAKLPDELLDAARQDPIASDAAFAEAITLREAIYRLFSEIADGRAAPDAELMTLNHALADAPSRQRLVTSGGAHLWACDIGAPTATIVLAPVLWSAGDLLARGDFRRLRRCANEACLWLFVDQSKAGTRRWCDMSSCGNRAKAQRHYQKTKHG